MNRETSDDPRLVLAVLNSLGVVGVNAAELKAFMKALKIYRKEKERSNEQWKEETKIKLLLQQGYFKNHLISFSQENTKENVKQEKKSRHQAKPMPENDHSKEILRQQSIYKNQFTNIRPINEEVKLASEKKPKRKAKPVQNDFSKENVQKFHPECREEINDKTKMEISCKNVKDSKPTPSIEKLEIHREPSATAKSQKSVASSVISSNKSCRQSSGLKSSKKIGSDPVTLYNQYKRYWSKLSFPGEESHAKLRWAVREKMLGSQPNPTPR